MVHKYKDNLLCSQCARYLGELLECPGDPTEPETYSSDEWPKSYPEYTADRPQHCKLCGEFLQNELTEEGKKYIREQAMEGASRTIRQYLRYYEIDICTDSAHAIAELAVHAAEDARSKPEDERMATEERYERLENICGELTELHKETFRKEFEKELTRLEG